MRLTLRTLLAYMDDILDPQDHEELEKRIESSELAHELIHRTRDTMRRLRLTAPAVSGQGMGLDPNTVAEYLDNTLPADQVADFERVCLESDVHLAEVASCHHVLTMVLGEPAEIDPDLRRQMYALPSQEGRDAKSRDSRSYAPLPPEEVLRTTTLDVSPVASVAPVHRVEVPDYLRAAEPSWARRLLPAVAAVLLLSVVSYFAFRDGGWLRGDAQLAEKEPLPPAPVFEEANPPAPVDSAVEQPAPVDEGTEDAGASDLEESNSVTEETTTDQMPLPETETDAATPAEPMVDPLDVPPAEGPVLPPQDVEDTTARPAPVVDTPMVPPPLPPLLEDTPPSVPDTDSAATGETADPAADAAVSPEMPIEEGLGVSETVPAEGDVLEGEQPAVLGTLARTQQVILQLEEDGNWRRLPPRDKVLAGSNLLALPTYRPMITMASGLNAELLGGTLVKLDAADPTVAVPVPRIDLVYGKVLLLNVSMSEMSVPIQVGEISGTARLKPSATIAIEAQRIFQPGIDAAKVPAPVAATMYAPAGGVTWESPDVNLQVTEPGQWQLAGDSVGPVEPYVEAPWIDGEPLGFWERMSSPAVERMINTDQPVGTQLLGLFESTKKKEEKALLAESNMHVGQFVPVVRSLKDPDQQPEWDQQISSLRMAMARSPELAERVLATLVEQKGADKAPDLYQMLCGYNASQIGTTPEEIQAGVLRQLIDWLESDQLDYRVLAFYNLKDITGKPLSYNPNGTPESRTRAVRQWRNRLRDNELLPQT